MPPIVKTVYLLRRKSCTRFGLDFSIFLLCHVKTSDEKSTRHVYLLGKNINKSSSSLSLVTVGLKFSSLNLLPTFAAILGVLAIQSSVIWG